MDEDRAEFLRQLAETTAGRFCRSKKTDLKEKFALIADELRFQYRSLSSRTTCKKMTAFTCCRLRSTPLMWR